MAKTEIEFQNTKKVEFLDYVKKKRRWAFFWGFLVAMLVFCIGYGFSQIDNQYPARGAHIAKVQVDRVILDDPERLDMLDEISKRGDVQALIVSVNSPGGTVFASEEIYKAIRSIGDHIPVVSVMKDDAASGGYIVSLAGDYIIAGDTTVTGSIGVISEVPDITELLDNIGVSTTLTRSSDGKGGISPLRTPTPEELENERNLINAMYAWFRDLVGERRGLAGNALDLVSQGAAFTGAQALELGLIDEIGSEAHALVYLRTRHPELDNLEVKDWEPLYPDSYVDNYAKALSAKSKDAVKRATMELGARSYYAIGK